MRLQRITIPALEIERFEFPRCFLFLCSSKFSLQEKCLPKFFEKVLMLDVRGPSNTSVYLERYSRHIVRISVLPKFNSKGIVMPS